MKSEKYDNLTNDPQTKELVDLPVPPDQAQQTSGGTTSSDTRDCNGHGTHVAGTVGSTL